MIKKQTCQRQNSLLSLIILVFLFITWQGIVFAKVNLPIMVTNSPFLNGINDSCGGCVSPAVCQSGTCVTPTNYSTDSTDCGAAQTTCGINQACMSGSCVLTTDVTSCFNGSSYAACNRGTCGGVANLPNGGQGNKTMTGICACSNGIINDNNNCGSCGNACTGLTAYCSYGQCIDANLCGDGGCAGTNCANVTQMGQACSDGNIYAGGNLEISPTNLTGMTWTQANTACQNLGTGWSLPTEEQLTVLYANNNKVGMSTSSGYWSSTQGSAGNAWYQNFNAYGWQYLSLESGYGISGRCVRSL